MQTTPYDAVFELNQASSLDALAKIFQKIMSEYGFDLFAVQYTTPELKKANAQPHYHCNFAALWVEHYYESKYYEIDPVISLGKKKIKPYYWSNLWDEVEMTKKQKEFFSEADDFGVSSGVGFPIFQHGSDPGIVSLVSSSANKREVTQITTEHHLTFALLATNFHYAAKSFLDKRPCLTAPHLTPREKECLKWAAIGKTDHEIGMILNISGRTVNFHMLNCYIKLECSSREQAVLKAYLLRLITL